MARLAVVLFNLGGPDSLEAVRPFLINLFSDAAIISAPTPVRWMIARLIAGRRTPVAQEIYRKLGGASPLLANTRQQAAALESALGRQGADEARVFIAMRYWHPMSPQTAREVAEWQPDKVVLLPLYPQYSMTTSGSSLADWHRSAAKAGLKAPTRAVCCWPAEAGLIDAIADGVRRALAAAGNGARVLFTAHGLPEKIIQAGDPYQAQVEATAQAIVDRLDRSDLDWVVCYQSRVGPLKWIEPATEDEVRRAGAEGRPVVMVPIAFVSEHSETLVELDEEYRDLAEASGVPDYVRVPTVGADPVFIDGLARVVARVAAEGRYGPHGPKGCWCSEALSQCPCGRGEDGRD